MNAQKRREALVGASVLLVEDNEINRQIAREILEDAGVVVAFAENGRVALEMLDAQPYDLVLMDIHMPVMNGLDATRALRRDPRFETLPIVALTAHVLQRDREACLAAGMNDYVAKPISPDFLLDTLQKWLPAPFSTNRRSTGGGGLSPLPAESFPADDAEGRRRLVAGHKETPERIRNRLNAGDRSGAALTAHGLRSLADHLGAVDIASIAAELERKIKGDASPQELAALADALDSALLRLSVELNRQLRPADADPLAEATANRARIDALMALLASADAEAVEFIDAHRTFLHGLLAQDYWAFEQRVTAYDFDGGLEILRRCEARVREALSP